MVLDLVVWYCYCVDSDQTEIEDNSDKVDDTDNIDTVVNDFDNTDKVDT